LCDIDAEEGLRKGAWTGILPEETGVDMSYKASIDLAIIIRLAATNDAPALARLAALDSRRVPPGRLLVAQVDGELWAATSSTGAVIADPFRPTADLVALLTLRAAQLELGEPSHRTRRGLVVPRVARPWSRPSASAVQ